jgi:hypothetical protein
LQNPGRAPDRVVIDVLEPELKAGDIAARERRVEVPREPVRVEGGRCDQIKPGGRRRFDAKNNSVLSRVPPM